MDSNPICDPSPTKKMKCLFLYYVILLMISWAGRWTWTPSATPLKPKKWNAHFCITFNFWWLARLVIGLKPHPPALSSLKKWNAHFWITFTFWWSAGLVDGLKPHLPPLSRHKIKCSFLHYVQLVMIGWAGQWTQTPSATSFQPKKWNANFWITLNFWWLAGLVNGLELHLPPFSNQKNEMAIFGFHSTSDDWPGWSMDSNSICYPSPAKKMKCLFLDYVQLLMICRAGQWIQTPSTTHLQPKKWNAHFWITFNFWWSARLVDGLKPHPPPLCSQKMKCSFLDYVQLLMIGQAGQ